MRKKETTIILVFTLVLSTSLVFCAVPKISATPETRLVPTQYDTIQAAINAANVGDTIYVRNGTYYENVVVNKTVSLIGESPSNTIIDGNVTESEDSDVVHIVANNVRVEGFTLQNGEGFDPASLSIWLSSGHTISNNVIKQSMYGVRIRESNSSRIINNVIVNNTKGIYISSSNNNLVVGNLLEKNSFGVQIVGITPKNNTFYHNNFINNTSQIIPVFAPTKWDNGAEGNYWSDYNGQDHNGDGIGDTKYLEIDNFPLIEKWSETRNFEWEGLPYHTIVQSNSTVASFNFTYSLAQISFNVTGPHNVVSFCNVTIDRLFLDGNFTVLIDQVSRDFDLAQNVTHSSVYFTFSHSTCKIQIRGTKVVGNMIPTVDFDYSPKSPAVNETVTFDASNSYDLNGTIMNYAWNFGDGNTSSQQNPIHKYGEKGTYAVTLTVIDDEGAINTITKTIVVAAFSVDYTLYYILVGIAAGTLILITTFLLKKKKFFSSPKTSK